VDACLGFRGGGWSAPGGERKVVGGVFEPGDVMVELDVGGEDVSPDMSRSFDIFRSNAEITTGALADRTLEAGESWTTGCGRGRVREGDGEELVSGVALVRSIVRRLFPITPKESSACPCVWMGECEASRDGERERVPVKIPLMVAAGEDNGMFILGERSDGGGEGEDGVCSAMGGVVVPFGDLIGWLGIIPCRRIESMTSMSPLGSCPSFVCARMPSPARSDLWLNTAFLIAVIQRCDSTASVICKSHIVGALSSPTAPFRFAPTSFPAILTTFPLPPTCSSATKMRLSSVTSSLSTSLSSGAAPLNKCT
jgi:hypothetical protein